MTATASHELWRRAEPLFHHALEAATAERPQLLAQLCGGDAELLGAVSALLAEAGEPTGEPTEEPTREPVTGALPRAHPAPAASGLPRLGAFRLLQTIGEGGMGTVYLAERVDGELEQKVAVKVLRVPLAGSRHEQRFRRERQILARLNHPNVARFIDAGTTPGGRPYAVLELIRGLPITDYCDARRLPVWQRLELFTRACGAVAAVHREHVVHRDLKPSNLLVTDAGEPKLIDFGIAKTLPEFAGRDRMLLTLDPLGTPFYASPEQLAGEAVTPASDVYSLGVLLYRLLTGVIPRSGLGCWLDCNAFLLPSDVCRLPASAAAGPFPLSPEARADLRSTTPSRLARSLAGGLDELCRICLAEDPRRRFPSAAELGDALAKQLASQRPARLRWRRLLAKLRA